MKHVTVYGESGIYAGWPANHGAWQWGDEFLVGFLRGPHKKSGMHNIKEPYQKVQARSKDGGNSWLVMVPNVDFECKTAETLPADYNMQDAIMRFCGRYDHGGEYCRKQGGFYLSTDKGYSWQGAYGTKAFRLAPNHHNTSRTCVLDDKVFWSQAHMDMWGTDYVICSSRTGKHPVVVLRDEYRAVMPAAARIDQRMVVVMRRRGGRGSRGCWIDAVHSDDNGRTWSDPVHVADTGINNGNPPALIELNGTLYCAYGYRGDQQVPSIWFTTSSDGVEWGGHSMLRFGECSDIGYPRMFKRSDNKLVCVYYWSDHGEEQRIEATVFL